MNSSLISCQQTSSRLYKAVIDYDYFQFMKKDCHYTFIFASRITITLLIIRFLILCYDYIQITNTNFLFDYYYGITRLRLQFDCTKFIMCKLFPFFTLNVLFILMPHQWPSNSKPKNWQAGDAKFSPWSRLSTQPFGVFPKLV